MEDLKRYRIVVMTLVTSGRLSMANFPKHHFTHVFVDEAGQALEPQIYIPLSGILEDERGQLVMAGDPQQLGPVVRSSIAIKEGLMVSLLERMMTNVAVYQRDHTGQYNNACITKLLKNFRSHPDLLCVPSQLFYDNELIASADPVVTQSLQHWETLPKPGFPLIFHGVMGKDMREANSPSFFNPEEVVFVVDYIEAILSSPQFKVQAKEIGVISPYQKQVEKVKQLLHSRQQKNPTVLMKDVLVGVAELFQGQERRVIIITTVRSEPDYLKADFRYKLGFLKNPKRFNVSITRAKALMIVVGNPKLLSTDPHWKTFIQFVQDKGGYTGVKFNTNERMDNEDELDVELMHIELKLKKHGDRRNAR